MAQLLSFFGAILTIATLVGSALGYIVGTFFGGWFMTAFGCVLGFAFGVSILWYITAQMRLQ